MTKVNLRFNSKGDIFNGNRLLRCCHKLAIRLRQNVSGSIFMDNRWPFKKRFDLILYVPSTIFQL